MTDLIIKELKEKYGESTANKLLSYLDMVLERNEHINLTAVRDPDEALVKHVLDSLAIVDLPEYKEAENLVTKRSAINNYMLPQARKKPAKTAE